jgi:hypothetical protein
MSLDLLTSPALGLSSVSDSVRAAVAPVFFLTSVAGMIATVAGRLARIVDRARKVQEILKTCRDQAINTQTAARELASLRKRGHWVNASIALLTLCAMSIGSTIMVLFLSRTLLQIDVELVVIGAFVGGVGFFLLAVLCFLIETVIAMRTLQIEVFSEIRSPVSH